MMTTCKLKRVQPSLQSQSVQHNTEDSPENPIGKYKTLHELYNSCSFALATRDLGLFEDICESEEWKATMEE